MDSAQRRTTDSLVRAANFLDAHPTILGELKDTPARSQLDASISQVQTHGLGQDGAGRSWSALVARQAHLTATLKESLMKPITQFARTSLRGVPDFAALTRSTRSSRGRRLVADARSMATAMTPLAQRFIEAKFPGNVIQELSGLADELEAVLAQRNGVGAARIAAGKGIREALRSGREAIRTLDPIVTRMLRSSELLAAWQSVKRIHRSTTASLPASAPSTPSVPSAAPEVAAQNKAA